MNVRATIRHFLTPSLDRDPDAGFNRNLLRGCIMLIGVLAASEMFEPGATALLFIAALGVYEAYLFSVVPSIEVAEDSALDFAGGSLGAVTAWAWVTAGGVLPVIFGVAMVAVPFARAWVTARQSGSVK